MEVTLEICNLSYKKPNSTVERVSAIDALRGFACLVVCASHLRLAFSHTTFLIDKLISFSALRLIVDGSWAVILFYIISGFSISLAVINSPSIDNLQKICRTRFLRLGYPLLLAWIIGLLLDKLQLFYHVQAGTLLKNDWLCGLVNYNVPINDILFKLLYGIWFSSEPPCIPVLWTISYLFLGTFVSIIFVLVLRNQKLLSFLLYTFIMFEWMKIYNSTFSFFLIGVGLAWIYDYTNGFHFFCSLNSIIRHIIIVILLFNTFIIYGMAEIYSGKFARHSMEWSIFADINYYYAGSAVCLILLVILFSKQNTFFSIKPIRLLGNISYSVWLIHSFVIASFSSYLYVLMRSRGINHSDCTPPVFIFSIIVIVLFSILFSNLCTITLRLIKKQLSCIVHK